MTRFGRSNRPDINYKQVIGKVLSVAHIRESKRIRRDGRGDEMNVTVVMLAITIKDRWNRTKTYVSENTQIATRMYTALSVDENIIIDITEYSDGTEEITGWRYKD